MVYYHFEYDGEDIYSSHDTNEIDRYVDEWLNEHFDELEEYSGYLLIEDNIETYIENFKSEYIKEYKSEER